MIVGLDSHYIYPEQSVERDELLAASGTHYDDEDGWYMDYPDDDTIRQRFAEQDVIPADEVEKAMRNTDLICDFEDYQSEVLKPTVSSSIYPDKTPEEKFKIYNRLISQKFKEYMKHVPPEDYQRYYDGVKMEVYTYKDTGMIDYPLMDYEIVKRGIQYGGIITNTGRGSAVSYFTNTLCGFSKLIASSLLLNFIQSVFVHNSHYSNQLLPDIDQNIDRQEPFERAQREILGEDHAYPMIALVR